MATPLPQHRMTSDEFIAWAMTLPDGEHYELVDGVPVAMSAERISHARVKARIWQALDAAIAAAGLPCEAFPDGMAVEVDGHRIYEPDALVRCGDPLPDETVKLTDPVIVVEVVSPSSAGVDNGAKLEDYFRIPSVRHYLIVKTDSRSVIHHSRDEGERIQTRIARGGPLSFDPPGITVTVERFFA